MKSREVFELLRSEVSPNLMKVLMALAERQSHQAKEIIEVAQMIQMIANLVDQMITVGEQAKSVADKIKKERAPGVASEPVND